MKYKRILLKLSGESLAGSKELGIDFNKVLEICQEIKEVKEKLNLEIAIVVGGGNYWRGRSNTYMDKCDADKIGMLATEINAIVLKDAFTKLQTKVKIQSAIEMNRIVELYTKDKTLEYLKEGNIVIFAGGTNNPFFSTDTGASLRAAEIEADVILKATNVDGIYDKDPNKHKDASMYKELTYEEVLVNNLQVMDLTAITMCKDNNIPIIVFNNNIRGNLLKVLEKNNIGTIVK
jgi:uridylate kinase